MEHTLKEQMSTMAWRRVGPGRWEYGVKQHGARWVQDGLELVRGKLHKKWVPEYKQPALVDKAALIVAIAALPDDVRLHAIPSFLWPYESPYGRLQDMDYFGCICPPSAGWRRQRHPAPGAGCFSTR